MTNQTEDKATPKKKSTQAHRAFDVIPDDIEFFDVTNRAKGISKRYTDEVKGMRICKLQEKLFEDGIPMGVYTFSMKRLNNLVPHNGQNQINKR